ncbi:hypothetical protein DT076_02280 [Desertihabitans brevis]|uniref:Uncharacterized protein n=1 Tax=Desertihabitans brevis TaxID=2268447 RepID=A0A367YZE8_9ACTN|nr:hypothetical protein [Desertihabitans brevis]RCK71285.1 hypothetical protein DT076_02280 [Desertihabitans brevis]
MGRGRRVLALLGALLFWFGLSMTLLFVAAAVWLLAHGTSPSWVVLAVTVACAVLGRLLIRLSGAPLSDALNV